MEPTYRFRATCTKTTFSSDLDTTMETINFHRLFDFVIYSLRFDHKYNRPAFQDRTTWEIFVDGKLAYTITYTCFRQEDCDDYTIRIFRHHGKPNQKVCYYIVKEG